MTVLLLALGALLSLPLTALGLPGTWAFLAGVGIWMSTDPTAGVSWTAFGVATALAAVGEVLEWTLATRYTAKYGGSRRAGWGALLGGLAGALVGVPVPVIGSVLGSLAGAFLGALVLEWTKHGEHGRAGQVAWGALVGRAMAGAIKVLLGVVIAVLIVASAIW